MRAISAASRARVSRSPTAWRLSSRSCKKWASACARKKTASALSGGRPTGAVIDSHADHRLAMAFGVLGTAVGDTTILGAESVEKTYPEFWKALASLGAKVESDVKQPG